MQPQGLTGPCNGNPAEHGEKTMLATLIYLTAFMPLPIRDCDTDSDCVAAAAAIGCREYFNPRQPEILFVCEREKYLKAVRSTEAE